MLESISLKFTELPELLRVPAQGVTVFVGPNNSGKSLVLREVEQSFSSYTPVTTKIVDDFEILWVGDQQVEEDIAKLSKRAPPSNSPDFINIGRFVPNGTIETFSVPRNDVWHNMRTHQNKLWLTSSFLRMFLIRLDGRTRFDLTNDQGRGDLLGPRQNMFMHLFQDKDSRKRVRDIVFDAFNLYFTIEQLSANYLRIRLSATEPDENEQNWNEAAREFHGKALHIKEASDGVQAFVGIVCAVLLAIFERYLLTNPKLFCIRRSRVSWVISLQVTSSPAER
jgi:hypothetical protein